MSKYSPSSKTAKKKPKVRLSFDETKSLEDWVALINDPQHLPLGEYAHKLLSLTGDNPSVDFDAAKSILEKALFKNKLLCLSDILYLNPVQSSFASIQRAMVILGFRSVRNIGLCLAIYNHVLEFSEQDPLIAQEIVLSTHSAILTALIAQRKSRILNCEPLVVAALTHSLGKILFQFFAAKTAAKHNQLFDIFKPADEVEERAIVGFLFKDLTLALVKHWQLGPRAISIHQIANSDNIDYAVQLAREVTQNIKSGWRDKKTIESMKKIEEYLGCTADQVGALVMESTEKVLEKIALYGKAELLDNILMPTEAENIIEQVHSDEIPKTLPVASRIKATVQQLSILVSGKNIPTVNEVMNIGLQGMFDGIDFDRVLFALITVDRTDLSNA